MTRSRLLTAALLSLSLPAAAGSLPQDDAFIRGTGAFIARETAGSVAPESRRQARLKKAQEVIDVAVTGMNDTAGVAERLIGVLRSQNVSVELAEGQKTMAEITEIAADIPLKSVSVSDAAAGLSPRHLTLHIAERASELAHEDLPDCAERRFMVLSEMSRSWLEMGGSRRDLPVFDGVKDDAMAEKVRTWIETDITGYAREAAKKGEMTLEGMEADLKSRLADADRSIEESRAKLKASRSAYEGAYYAKEIEAKSGLRGLLKLQGEKKIQNLREQVTRFQQEESDWFMTNPHLTR